MRFCNFYLSDEKSALPRPGVLIGDRVRPLEAIVGNEPGLRVPGILEPVPIGFATGDRNNIEHLPIWVEQLKEFSDESESIPGFDPEALRYAPPVWNATSFRDFYAFEQHVKTARAKRGLEVAPEWYKFPVFYFSNHRRFITHGDELTAPKSGEWLDFELEVAAVLVYGGSNLTPGAAEACIGGYCVLNDWSLRDVQRREMSVGLGPAKGKDFASGLGPWLVTPDEIESHRDDKGYNLVMSASINGKQVSKGNWKDIHYSFGEMISRASADAEVSPGDVIGSGTVGTGCILELGTEVTGGWLKPGDEVELNIERLGTLRNRIVQG